MPAARSLPLRADGGGSGLRETEPAVYRASSFAVTHVIEAMGVFGSIEGASLVFADRRTGRLGGAACVGLREECCGEPGAAKRLKTATPTAHLSAEQ